MKTKIFDIGTRDYFLARSALLFILGVMAVFMTNETNIGFLSIGVGIGFLLAGLIVEDKQK